MFEWIEGSNTALRSRSPIGTTKDTRMKRKSGSTSATARKRRFRSTARSLRFSEPRSVAISRALFPVVVVMLVGLESQKRKEGALLPPPASDLFRQPSVEAL